MEDIKYAQYPDMEPVSFYCKGGYHPVIINDVFHDRYRIVNKLGYGAFATVWLAEDLALKRCVSLKVLVASASSEIDVVRHLKIQQQTIPPPAGAEYVVKIFDDFEIEGPNGTHRCIVTELLGRDLACWYLEDQFDDEKLPLLYRKKIAAQIAHGVAYLHKCGVVHGDLHLRNILLYNSSMEHWSLEDCERNFGKPVKLPLTRFDDDIPITNPSAHLPKYLVFAHEISVLDLCLSSLEALHIKICDFGEAFFYNPASQTLTTIQLNTPAAYAAPEIFFPEPTNPVGPPTDVWALAVALHMVLSGNCPLFLPGYNPMRKIVLAQMVLLLGKFPERWWTQWAERAEFFDESGVLVNKTQLRVCSTFLRAPDLNEDEKEVFESLLRKMVCYKMQDRILPDEVVRLLPDDWMSGSRQPCQLA